MYTKDLSEIRHLIKQINLCIDNWKTITRGPFSWVDDGMCGVVPDRDFCYYLHCNWVTDWNRSFRKKEAPEFLRDWITEENIVTILQLVDEWNHLTQEQTGDETQ